MLIELTGIAALLSCEPTGFEKIGKEDGALLGTGGSGLTFANGPSVSHRPAITDEGESAQPNLGLRSTGKRRAWRT